MNNTLAMKKFEIVVGIEKFDPLMDIIQKCGIRGYTTIKEVGGYGSRGVRDPDDVLLEQENVMVVVACKEDQAQKLLDRLRPVMKDFGGMCLISDCNWVEGPAISY